jgi:hypothetical protein
MVYGWTIVWFFWKLPSWLYFMTMGEIGGIFAYSMAMNFLESLTVVLAPVLLCLLLPSNWFFDNFIARGVSLAMLWLGYSMLFTTQMQDAEGYPKNLLVMSVLAVLLAIPLASVVGKISIVRKFLEAFSDRAIVFLYLSIPISAISLLFFIFRNLF